MTDTLDQPESAKTDGGNETTVGRETRKTAVRAAAIAAAGGATALAAKKLSGRGPSSDRSEGAGRKPARKSTESVLPSALTSSWEATFESLVPILENAARHAGEYVARNAPEVVSDKLMPNFIRGFERARKKSSRGSREENETSSDRGS